MEIAIEKLTDSERIKRRAEELKEAAREAIAAERKLLDFMWSAEARLAMNAGTLNTLQHALQQAQARMMSALMNSPEMILELAQNFRP